MNTQEYISSGILEAYVLGSVSTQEKQEVECLSKIYPEIKTELESLEEGINVYSKAMHTAPPAHLKAKIFAQMTFDEPAETIVEAVSEAPEARTLSMPMWPKFAAAAAVVLGVLLGFNYMNTQKLETELAAINGKLQETSTETEASKAYLALYKSKDLSKISLQGVEKYPESAVTVFWNKQTSEVKLVADNLPAAPSGKQYQLWTIVDGVPVDMGMLDLDFKGKILNMKNANGKAVAFAITLEKLGGSPAPTMEEMYVIGNV